MKRILYIQLLIQLALAGIFIPIYLAARIDIERNIATESCLIGGKAVPTAFAIANNLGFWFFVFSLSSILFTIYTIKKAKNSI